MTVWNSVNVIEPLIAMQASQDGKGYSELGPPGSDDDGHYWEPGDPIPTEFDCSGFEDWSWGEFGVFLNHGTAWAQWETAVGGRVPLISMRRGDSVYFNGARPPDGHVGTVLSFNPETGLGTFRSALDTMSGVCVIPFSTRTAGGPLAVVGATRPAASLPNPPVTPPRPPTLPPVDVFITANPKGSGDYLCSWSTRRAVGIPDGPDEIQVETTGVARHNINEATFAYFTPEVWPAATGA